MEPSKPPKSFPRVKALPEELIEHILEESHKVRRIANLRVVSRRFDRIIVPITYRHVTLTRSVIASFSVGPELYDLKTVQHQVARDIRAHTRHLVVDRQLDWKLLEKLIRSLKGLHSFTWAFWGRQTCPSPNDTVGPALSQSWPDIHLHFGRINNCYRPQNFSKFPPQRLFTCKVAAWHSWDDNIRNMLLAQPNLQKLRLISDVDYPPYYHVPRIHEPANASGERLPPLQELVLDGYAWYNSTWAAVNFWDWSNITHLELRNTQVDIFLRTVPPQYLSGLRTFITDSGGSLDHRGGKDRLLCSLVTQTSCLEELRMRYDVEKDELLSAVAQNGSGLHTLELRCFNDYTMSGWSPLLNMDLVEIRSGCLQLMELDVDVDMAWPEASQILSASAESEPEAEETPGKSVILPTAEQKKQFSTSMETLRDDPAHPLSGFRNLRRLTIYTCVNHFVEQEGCNVTHERTSTVVHEWLDGLLSAKQGARFEKVVIHARSKRVNTSVGADAWTSKSTYVYEGREDSSGAPEIVEGEVVCLC